MRRPGARGLRDVQTTRSRHRPAAAPQGAYSNSAQPLRQQIPAPLLLDPLPPPLPHPAPQLRVAEQRDDPVGGLLRRTAPDDPARLAVEHRVRRPAGVAGDDRQPRRGRLQVDDAEPLDVEAAAPGPARHREDVTRAVVRGQLRPRHGAGEADGVGDPGLVARACAAPSRTARRRRSAAPRPGSPARIRGIARISVSCPLRGTSRETQTTTGRSVSPSRARTSSPPEPGWKVFSSTPGGSWTIRAAASGVSAAAIRERVYSPRYVIVSVDSPIRRSSWRAAGSCAQPGLVPVRGGHQPLARPPCAARAPSGRAGPPPRTTPTYSRVPAAARPRAG